MKTTKITFTADGGRKERWPDLKHSGKTFSIENCNGFIVLNYLGSQVLTYRADNLQGICNAARNSLSAAAEQMWKYINATTTCPTTGDRKEIITLINSVNN